MRPIDNGQMEIFTQRDDNGNIVYVEVEYEDKTNNALPAGQQLLGDGSFDGDDDVEYPDPEDEE